MTVPVAVEPFAGAVIDTVGGVVSGAFATVMDTLPETVVFPAASRARAASTCPPSVVVRLSHASEYGAVVSSAPIGEPSRRNWTPETPLLSDALAEIVIVPAATEPLAGAVIDTVGATVSGIGVPPTAVAISV